MENNKGLFTVLAIILMTFFSLLGVFFIITSSIPTNIIIYAVILIGTLMSISTLVWLIINFFIDKDDL